MVLQTQVFKLLDISTRQIYYTNPEQLSIVCFVPYGEVCLPFPMIPWCNAEVIEALALRVSLKYAVTLTLFDLL